MSDDKARVTLSDFVDEYMYFGRFLYWHAFWNMINNIHNAGGIRQSVRISGVDLFDVWEPARMVIAYMLEFTTRAEHGG